MQIGLQRLAALVFTAFTLMSWTKGAGDLAAKSR